MFLIVGLGNPGQKYQNNRHNIGFRVLDSLIYSFNAIKQSDKNFQGEVYKANQLLFLKPQTFMNLSGQSVQSVKNFYKITDFAVVHDELDLPFGAVKFKFGGGSGGHNGLKSIDSLCGNEYYRIRYGIGKPSNKEQVIHWVLNDFSKEEEMENPKLIAHCAKASLEIATLESPKELSNKISSIFTLNPNTSNTKNKESQAKNLKPNPKDSTMQTYALSQKHCKENP
ncbi:aminoacyl-tRNA hydrolase [Helicobacter sp. MIT 05-5294]|uniref:aminoacyl-tRNA hydrolase n=1 Tax=Helicobacter sp. MIT 05-5294 TaxID=1548150 RepID=UPI0010FD9B6E|nr:aminoacyl-tRNA hydrolase [Helicobacter sp. MIT 05-5294]TLD87586.1 aminoacyl-tRNA hydrolase [Helicobacter sp. MIT 05-5294]